MHSCLAILVYHLPLIAKHRSTCFMVCMFVFQGLAGPLKGRVPWCPTVLLPVVTYSLSEDMKGELGKMGGDFIWR